jgi:hypothetical protein
MSNGPRNHYEYEMESERGIWLGCAIIVGAVAIGMLIMAGLWFWLN